MFCPRIAITCGEPAGVGPEISVRAALESADNEIVLIGDAIQIKALAAQLEPHKRIDSITVAELSALPQHAGRDRKSTRLNSSHSQQSRMPSSA